jgi:signal transduction histidine kinase
VKDDGPGIAAKDMPYIFDRFYKGENGNFGLGLAICKEIIDRLEGDLVVENIPHPSQGAKFTIMLNY